MKKILLYTASALLSLSFIGCNDKWDDHYKGGDDRNEVELNQTIQEFLAENQEYSKFADMLTKTGLDKELNKDQEITIWVADNTAMEASGIADDDTIRMQYHINNLPFINADLKDNLRIRSLNGIYFQISEKNEELYVNDSKILKSYRLNNGVVHIIDELMKSRINMYNFLKGLDDDYSIIRDSIFAYDTQVFDKANSRPIGVDKTGNTIYDSVFYTYNDLFEKAKFDSEFNQFTVFVPSNEVMKNCFDTMNDSYAKMGKTVTQEDTLLAMQWIKEAMFYNGILSDFSSLDIKSSFDRVWRTTIQKIDESNPVDLSNGKLYYMEKVKVPNNVIISRIKSLVEYWRYQDPTDLYPSTNDLYTFTNPLKKVATDGTVTYSINTTDNTGVPTAVEHLLAFYTTLDITGDPSNNDEFSVEFPPLERYQDGLTYKARVMEVPTGEYSFYMGFRASAHPYVDIYFNGKLVQESVQASLSTPWNFDRVTETSKDRDPINGITRWDGLGGLVGVVNIDGDGMASFRVKVKFNKLESAGAAKRMQLYHWSLKPTENNY